MAEIYLKAEQTYAPPASHADVTSAPVIPKPHTRKSLRDWTAAGSISDMPMLISPKPPTHHPYPTGGTPIPRTRPYRLDFLTPVW